MLKNTLKRFLMGGLLLLSLPSALVNALEVSLYVSEPEEINTTSALIKGHSEMMVVSAQPNISAATRLANEIEATGLELKYIFLTHAHLDHFQGASVLLKRFPNARFIATPDVAELQRKRIAVSDDLARSRYGDNAAVPSPIVAPYNEDTIFIDGQPVELSRGFYGDVALGEPDEPHTVAYVPSAHTLIPSDIIYYNGHVMMGGSTKESRRIWLTQINHWLKQDYKMVIPGHMPKGSDLTPMGALTHTRDYIMAYDLALENHDNAEDVIAEMKRQFPTIGHESALLIGTYMNFKVMHKLLFNPTVETIFSILPDALAKWIDEKIYESKKADWQGEHIH
ncbi:MAG: MBL fold metallo-hydrolase [Candidatus Pelagadaptatus aseana]|uniref:MBL fold metallo-hydrolase n=1 Tax=Candidatus Pelagadaptatus aseana TaxID=3120508 RepID=UPI0039B35B3C